MAKNSPILLEAYCISGNFRVMQIFIIQKFDRGNIRKGHPLAVNLRMEKYNWNKYSYCSILQPSTVSEIFRAAKITRYTVCMHVTELISHASNYFSTKLTPWKVTEICNYFDLSKITPHRNARYLIYSNTNLNLYF